MSYWLATAEVASSLISIIKYAKSFFIKEVIETKQEIDSTNQEVKELKEEMNSTHKDVKELQQELHILNEKLDTILHNK